MKNTELEQAAQELEKLTKSEGAQAEQATEPDVAAQLAETAGRLTGITSGLTALMGRLFKSHGEGEEKVSGEIALTDALTKSEAFQEYHRSPDASDALIEFQGAVGQGLSAIDARVEVMEKSLAAVLEAVNEIAGGLGVLMKSQAKVHEYTQKAPRSYPDRGVTVVTQGVAQGGENLQKSEARHQRGEVQIKLEEAVQKQDLQSGILGVFARDPNRALRSIPEEVRKSYGIPASL